MKKICIRRVVGIIAFFLISAEFFPWIASAEENYCDPYLNPREDHPYGYRLRGDRCEGIYVKKVSSTALLPVSLTESFSDYDIADNDNLIIAWKPVDGRDIRLRAYGVKPRLYYRMDTVRPGGSTSYLWPTDVLSALSIKKNNIGLIAWTDYSINNTPQNLYLPLRIGDPDSPSEQSGYQLSLLPGRELKEIFFSIASSDKDGSRRIFLEDGRALKYGYYPPGRLVNIQIVNLDTPGIYYVHIGATLSGGGSTTTDFWFYHAGK